MDDVIPVLSSPLTRLSPPRLDLGVIEITDSEPDDLDNDAVRWIEGKEDPFLLESVAHLHQDIAKENSPMDIDAPNRVVGPSSSSPVPQPSPDVPVIRIQPDINPRTTGETGIDSYSKHLALVLEVIPDVLPQHALELVAEFYPTYGDQAGEWVVQKLFDGSPYPKIGMGNGKGKRKASDLEDSVEASPARIKIDFASVDRPKPTGKNYRTLALVSFSSSANPCILSAI